MHKEEIKMENNNKAYVNLYNGENAPGLVGFATVMYNGLRISGIQIRLKKDGEYVKDENGYSIKDYIVNPLSKEVRQEIEELIDSALAEALDKAQ